MSSAVVTALPSVFGTAALSDCDVVFSLEGLPGAKQTAPARTLIGEPLPAHSLVLGLASERFRAQVERWADGATETSSSPASRRPQLRVPLGSEAEAPFARAAIGYAYTGRVAAVGVRAVLEVRRQAAYLQIDGCAAACDERLMGLLTASKVRRPRGTVRVAPAPSSAVAELMGCWDLMPYSADDPSFAPILAAAKKALVPHFGDALAVLNTPSLRWQLLQLPAAAVEVLLSSEVFGTDTEDSVLLLLATWMKANHSQTDAKTRERLCRLVRLVHLSRPYLTAVLPALAADYENGAAGSPCAWFPISVAEAGFITDLAATPAVRERAAALVGPGKPLYDTQSPWYRASSRPQCLSKERRTFEWAITEQELREELGRLPERGVNAHAYGSFSGGDLYLRGFEWKVLCHVRHNATCAGCYLDCAMPAAYDMPGSRLGYGSKAAAVGLDARLAVHSWGGGARQDAFVHKFEAWRVTFSAGRLLSPSGYGSSSALRLAQPQPAGGVDVLAGWAAYLRDGRLTGTLTLLSPFC
ncbi:hypothetical protein TSOC_007149 [Tetrabaena socialis]|uniref:BACK domain-containing protein n=1 Tax=Tetrabaena socialis TaxID=47790 RepID=A0A2J8A200_9CHLO|nr:hypothetical protein TSOC_007149 [Tetrabaena socialis]|eukprot:PNH06518.1 hypothetical protein TSOC_007149 [Tetrabaena socialis]